MHRDDFSNRERDERVSVRKSLKTKILRKTHVKSKGTGGTETYSDAGHLKPVPSDKCHSSCPESCDSIARWKGLVELEIRPPSHVKHVMRLRELYKRVKGWWPYFSKWLLDEPTPCRQSNSCQSWSRCFHNNLICTLLKSSFYEKVN